MDREEARELIREYVGRLPRPVTSIAPVNKRNPERTLFPDYPKDKDEAGEEIPEMGLD